MANINGEDSNPSVNGEESKAFSIWQKFSIPPGNGERYDYNCFNSQLFFYHKQNKIDIVPIYQKQIRKSTAVTDYYLNNQQNSDTFCNSAASSYPMNTATTNVQLSMSQESSIRGNQTKEISAITYLQTGEVLYDEKTNPVSYDETSSSNVKANQRKSGYLHSPIASHNRCSYMLHTVCANSPDIFKEKECLCTETNTRNLKRLNQHVLEISKEKSSSSCQLPKTFDLPKQTSNKTCSKMNIDCRISRPLFIHDESLLHIQTEKTWDQESAVENSPLSTNLPAVHSVPPLESIESFQHLMTKLQQKITAQTIKRKNTEIPYVSCRDVENTLPFINHSSLALIMSNNALSRGENSTDDYVDIFQTDVSKQPQITVDGMGLKSETERSCNVKRMIPAMNTKACQTGSGFVQRLNDQVHTAPTNNTVTNATQSTESADSKSLLKSKLFCPDSLKPPFYSDDTGNKSWLSSLDKYLPVYQQSNKKNTSEPQHSKDSPFELLCDAKQFTHFLGKDQFCLDTKENPLTCKRTESEDSFTSCLPTGNYETILPSLEIRALSVNSIKSLDDSFASLPSSSRKLSSVSSYETLQTTSDADHVDVLDKGYIKCPQNSPEINIDSGLAKQALKSKCEIPTCFERDQTHSNYGVDRNRWHKEKTLKDSHMVDCSRLGNSRKDEETILANEFILETGCSFDAVSELKSTKTFSQEGNKAVSFSGQNINPTQTQNQSDLKKMQKRQHIQSNVQQWLSSVDALEKIQVSCQRTINSEKNLIPGLESDNFNTNLQKVDPTCLSTVATLRDGRRIISTKENDCSFLQKDTQTDTTCYKTLVKHNHKENQEVSIAPVSPDNDADTKFPNIYTQPGHNLTSTTKADVRNRIGNSNAANSRSYDVSFGNKGSSPLSDYKSCISLDVVSACQENESSSGSDSFSTARSKENVCFIDTFVPISTQKQVTHQHKNTPNEDSAIAGIPTVRNKELKNVKLCGRKSIGYVSKKGVERHLPYLKHRRSVGYANKRTLERYLSDPGSLNFVVQELSKTHEIIGHFLKSVLKQTDVKTCGSLNELRLSPKICGHVESKSPLISSSSKRMSDYSSAWYTMSKETHSNILPFLNISASNQLKEYPQIEMCHSLFATKATNTLSATEFKGVSPAKSEEMSTICALGKNIPGGDQESVEPFQGLHYEDKGKKTPYSVHGPAVLSVVAVSRNGLLTSDVSLQVNSTVDRKMPIYTVLPEVEDIRLEMPPYHSTIAEVLNTDPKLSWRRNIRVSDVHNSECETVSIICGDEEDTQLDFNDRGLDQISSENSTNIPVSVSDQMKDYIYVCRVSSTTGMETREHHCHVVNEYLQHKEDNYQDRMSEMANDITFPIIAANPMYVFLDTTSTLQELYDVDTTGIQSSPSDEEVAFIMCESHHSPDREHFSACRFIDQEVLFPDEATHTINTNKGSSTPYPLLSTDIVRQIQENEDQCIESGTSIVYHTLPKDYHIHQATKTVHLTDSDDTIVPTNRGLSESNLKNSTTDWSPYLSSEANHSVLTKMLNDAVTESVVGEQNKYDFFSKIEKILNLIYREYIYTLFLNEMDDFNCHSTKHFIKNASFLGQSHSPHLYKKSSDLLSSSEDREVRDILRFANKDDGLYSNNDENVTILSQLLKDISDCLKKISSEYKQTEQMFNEKNNGMKFDSKNGHAQGTASLLQSNSNDHVNPSEKHNYGHASSTSGKTATNVKSEIRKKLQSLLTQAFKFIHRLKLQIDTRSTQSSLTESFVSKKHPELQVLHDKFLPWQNKPKIENGDNMNSRMCNNMSLPKTDMSNWNKKSCSSQDHYEKVCHLRDFSRKSALKVGSTIDKENVGNESCDKSKLLGKIEIMCRYLEIPTCHIDRLLSDDVWTSILNDRTTSSDSMCGNSRSWNDNEADEQHCATSASSDNVNNNDVKQNLSHAAVHQSNNSAYKDMEGLPFIVSKTVEADVRSAANKKGIVHPNTVLTKKALSSILNSMETPTLTNNPNLVKTDKSERKVENNETRLGSSPLGISSYTILQHPDWNEFYSVNSAFLATGKSYKDKIKTGQTTLPSKMKMTDMVKGDGKSCLHKNYGDRTFPLLRSRCPGLQHSFPGVATIKKAKYHLSVPRTEPIVYTLGPPENTYSLQCTQTSTGSLKGQNINLHNDHRTKEYQRPTTVPFTVSSEFKTTRETCKNGTFPANTIDTSRSFVGTNTLRAVSDQAAEFKCGKEYMITNTRGAKGYSLHRIDNNSTWNNRSLLGNSFPMSNNKTELHPYNNMNVIHAGRFYSSHDKKNLHKKSEDIKNNDNRTIFFDCCNARKPQKVCLRSMETNKEKKTMQICPPKQNVVDSLDELNALSVPSCKISETVDTVNRISGHNVTHKDAKCGNKNQSMSQCTEKIGQDKFCDCVTPASDGFDFEQTDMSGIMCNSLNGDVLQSMPNNSETDDVYDDGPHWNQQSYFYDPLEAKTQFKYFSHMSTNQNAADSPPPNSDDFHESKNQPVFSKFMHGYPQEPDVPTKNPRSTCSEPCRMLEGQDSTSESYVAFSTSSGSSTVSACSSREKLSVSDKIDFFTKKIENLNQTNMSKAAITAETHKTTSVRSMLEKYESATKISKDPHSSQTDFSQFSHAHVKPNKTHDSTEEHSITSNKHENDKQISHHFKFSEPLIQPKIKAKYVQDEESHLSNDEKGFAVGDIVKSKTQQSTLSESSKNGSLPDNSQTRSNLNVRKLSSCSVQNVCKPSCSTQLSPQFSKSSCLVENVCKPSCSTQLSPQYSRQPKTMSNTSIPCTNPQDGSKKFKGITSQKQTELSGIKSIKSAESFHALLFSTKHTFDKKPESQQTDNAIRNGVAKSKSLLTFQLKDDFVDKKCKSDVNDTNIKSPKLFQQRPDHAHSDLGIQNHKDTDISNQIKSAFPSSETPQNNLSKRLIPCTNKTQMFTQKPLYHRGISTKSADSMQMKLPVSKRDKNTWKWIQCVDKRHLPVDAFDTHHTAKRKITQYRKRVKDSVQINGSQNKSNTVDMQREPTVVSSGSLEIIRKMSAQAVSHLHGSYEEEFSSSLSGCLLASDSESVTFQTPSTESSQTSATSTASSDSYTTATQEVHRTTEEHVYHENNQQKIRNAGINYRHYFGDKPQFDRFCRSRQTYSTVRTVPFRATVDCESTHTDCLIENNKSPDFLHSQENKRDIMHKRRSNFSVRQDERSLVFDEGKHGLNQDTADLSYMHINHKYSQQCPFHWLKHECNTLPSKNRNQFDSRIFRSPENIKGKSKDTVTARCLCTTKKKSANKISSKIDLTKSKIVASESPLLNLPKYIGKLARFFKEPISHSNILSRPHFFTSEDVGKHGKDFMKMTENFSLPECSHQLRKAVKKENKQKQKLEDQSSKKLKLFQRSEIGVVQFQSPIPEQTNITASPVSKRNSTLIYKKDHDISGCFNHQDKQEKQLKPETIAHQSDTSKFTSFPIHKQKIKDNLQNYTAKVNQKSKTQRNMEHIPNNTCSKCTAEVEIEDDNLQNDTKVQLKAARANFSKNAHDDVTCQKIKDIDEHYETPFEDDFDLFPFIAQTSHKIIIKNKPNEKKITNKGYKMKCETVDDVAAGQRSPRPASNQDKFQSPQLTLHDLCSSCVKSYMTSQTETDNMNKILEIDIIPEPSASKGGKKLIQNNALRSPLSNSQKPLTNISQQSSSKGYASKRQHASHNKGLVADLKQCSSQETVRESSPLSSSDDGFISHVRVKRGCTNIHNAFSEYGEAKIIDFEAHVQNPKQHEYSAETSFDDKRDTGIKTNAFPKKDACYSKKTTTGKKKKIVRNLDAAKNSWEKQKQNLIRAENPETQEPFKENNVMMSTLYEKSKLSDEGKVEKTPKCKAVQNDNKAETSSKSTAENNVTHNKKDTKNEDLYKHTGDCSKNAQESSGNKELKPQKILKKEQLSYSSGDCKYEHFISPIAKIEILKPGSKIEVMTTVGHNTQTCQGESFYSPKNEIKSLDEVSFKTSCGQFSSTKGKRPNETNKQEVFVQRKAKNVAGQILDPCTSATKNVFTSENTEEIDSLLSYQTPVVYIQTKSVNLIPEGFVSQRLASEGREIPREKCTFQYHDPHTMPGKVHKSKTFCNIPLKHADENEMPNIALKPIAIVEKTIKSPSSKDQLGKEETWVKTSNHSSAEQHSGRICDKYYNRFQMQDRLMSIRIPTQTTKSLTSDVYGKGSMTNLREYGDDRKAISHKCSHSDFASLNRKCLHCLPNSKIALARSKNKNTSRLYNSNGPIYFSSGENMNPGNCAMYKECVSIINSPNFPQKTSANHASFNSCLSSDSSVLPSDRNAGFHAKEATGTQQRYPRKKCDSKHAAISSNGLSSSDNIKSSEDSKVNLGHLSQHWQECNPSNLSSELPPATDSFPTAYPFSSLAPTSQPSGAHFKHFRGHPMHILNFLKSSSQNNNRGSCKVFPCTRRGRKSKSNGILSYEVKHGKYIKVLSNKQAIFYGINNNKTNQISSVCHTKNSELKRLRKSTQINDTWFKNKDNNSNKKPTTFKITAESSGDKKASPTFKIEVSPLSADSSDEPVTRVVRLDEMQTPQQSAKFVISEVKRNKKVLKNALQHSFPPCAYKSSSTKIHSGRIISKMTESSCDNTYFSSTTEVIVSEDTAADEKERKQDSPSSCGRTTQFKVQTKSPPKKSSASSPRVFEISATIDDKDLTPPAYVQKQETRTIIHSQSYEPEEDNSCISMLSAVLGVPLKVRSPIASSKFYGGRKDMDISQTSYMTLQRQPPILDTVKSGERRHSFGSKLGKVTRTTSSFSISPSCAEVKCASFAEKCPKHSKHRKICQTLTKENLSSDSAMDLMAEALTSLKENPPAEKRKNHPKRGIQNFRLARKSSCSIVSAVPSLLSVQGDHQLRTTRNFTVKRNTSIKRLCSVKTDSERRLKQARRTLRMQELLIRLVGKTQALLKNVMFTTRREIVEEKNRVRQRQLRTAMKIASYQRLLQNSLVQSTSSSSSEQQHIDFCSSGESVSNIKQVCSHQLLSVTRSSADCSSPDFISVQITTSEDTCRGHDLRCNQSYPPSSSTTSEDFCIFSEVELQPVVDNLCLPCLKTESIRRSLQQQKLRSPSYSTRVYNLHCRNQSHVQYSISTPSLTIVCPKHRLCIQHQSQLSKSDSSISYTFLGDSEAENQQSRAESRKKFPQRKNDIPLNNVGTNSLHQWDSKYGMSSYHLPCPKDFNRCESKKSILTNKASASNTRLVHVHDKYFDHLQQLAKRVASVSIRDASRFKLKMRKPSQSMGPCQLQTENRYLLSLKDISRMVGAVCMAAINQDITTDWRKFCSVLLKPKQQLGFISTQACSDRSGFISETSCYFGSTPVRSSQGLCCMNNQVKRVRVSEIECGVPDHLRKSSTACREEVFRTLNNKAMHEPAGLYSEVYLEQDDTQRKRGMGHNLKSTLKGYHQSSKARCQGDSDFCRSDGGIKTTEVTSYDMGCGHEMCQQTHNTVLRSRHPSMVQSEKTSYASCCSLSGIPNNTVVTNTSYSIPKDRFLSKSIIGHCLKTPRNQCDQIPHRHDTSNRYSKPYNYKPKDRKLNTTQMPYVETQCCKNHHNTSTRFNQSNPDQVCLMEQYQESIEELSSSLSFGSVESRTERRTSKIFISTLPEESQKTIRCLQHQRSQSHNRHKDKPPQPFRHEYWNDQSDCQQIYTPTTDRFISCKCGRVDSHVHRKINPSVKCPHHGVNFELRDDSNLSCSSRHYACDSDVSGPSHIHIDIQHSYHSDSRLKQTNNICRESTHFPSKTVNRNSSQHMCHIEENKTDCHRSQPENTIKKNGKHKCYAHEVNQPKSSGQINHQNDSVEQPVSNRKAKPIQHLPSSFCGTKYSKHVSPKRSVFPERDHTDMFSENYPQTGCLVHQSLLSHNPSTSYSPHNATDNGRHYPRPSSDTEDEPRYQNKTIHGHNPQNNADCSSRKVSGNVYPTTHQPARYVEDSKVLKKEIQQRVTRNMKRLAKDHPQDIGRLSYQQLLRANDKVMDNLQRTIPWDADSLNRAFRKAVYHCFLQVHQPDMYFPQQDLLHLLS